LSKVIFLSKISRLLADCMIFTFTLSFFVNVALAAVFVMNSFHLPYYTTVLNASIYLSILYITFTCLFMVAASKKDKYYLAALSMAVLITLYLTMFKESAYSYVFLAMLYACWSVGAVVLPEAEAHILNAWRS